MASKVDAYKTARSRIIEFAMIDNQSAWPKADSGKCCIFEALNITGLAMFGQDWTGTELLALHWHEQPKAAEARRKSALTMLKVLTKAPIPPSSLSSGRSVYNKNALMGPEKEYHFAHIWTRAAHFGHIAHEAKVANEQELWEGNQKALSRLTDATEWLSQQCRDSKLKGFFRFQSGGLLAEMAAPDWNVEYPLSRFVKNGGYDRWFVASSPPRQWPVYVFFDRNQLVKAISNFGHVPAMIARDDLAKLSPYLQFAVKLAQAKNYLSASDCDTKPVREAEVRAAWNEAFPNVPQTPKQVEMLASLIGWPDPDAIKRGSLGGAKRKK